MTDTPIYDELLFSNPDYVHDDWINPFRRVVWDGKVLKRVEFVRDDDIPDGHREDGFS